MFATQRFMVCFFSRCSCAGFGHKCICRSDHHQHSKPELTDNAGCYLSIEWHADKYHSFRFVCELIRRGLKYESAPEH